MQNPLLPSSSSKNQGLRRLAPGQWLSAFVRCTRTTEFFADFELTRTLVSFANFELRRMSVSFANFELTLTSVSTNLELRPAAVLREDGFVREPADQEEVWTSSG